MFETGRAQCQPCQTMHMHSGLELHRYAGPKTLFCFFTRTARFASG